MKNPILTKKRIRKITAFFNSDKGSKYIPYGVGAWYISWFCSTEFAVKRFFNKKVPIIEEFLESHPGKWDNKEVISGFFALNYLHGWRSSKISHMSKFTLKRRAKISGLKILKEYYDKGQGVILLGSHYGLPAVSFSLFPRLGYRNFCTIIGEKGTDSVKFKGIKKALRPKIMVFKREGESEAFSMLFEAKEYLESGNILHLLGDGAHGKSSHNYPFLGKLHGYRATFAELSLLTGVPILPIFIVPHKGKIHLTIENKLDTGRDDMEREERVNLIVEQYSKLLEQKWVENPSFVNGGFMEMHNRQIQAMESY